MCQSKSGELLTFPLPINYNICTDFCIEELLQMAKLKTGRHTSALKAQRQAVKRTSANKGLIKKVRLATKTVKASAATKAATLKDDLKKANSCIDKAAKKKTIHWKTAARKKSRLAKAANKAK